MGGNVLPPISILNQNTTVVRKINNYFSNIVQLSANIIREIYSYR